MFQQDLLRISIETLTGDSRVLLEDKLGPSSAWSMPVSLQLGDYNKDGYPDVALITIPSRKNAGGTNDRNGLDETRVTLLENVACSSLSVPNKPSFGCTRERENEGTFRLVREGAGVLEGLRDVRRVSWVDVDEDVSRWPLYPESTFISLTRLSLRSGYARPALAAGSINSRRQRRQPEDDVYPE